MTSAHQGRNTSAGFARSRSASEHCAALLPFVERRSDARLRETPLRRRTLCRTAPASIDRRAKTTAAADIASTLERQLDAYPSKAAMLTYLRSLIYAADGSGDTAAHMAYRRALECASAVVRRVDGPHTAVATLHGYQAFMALSGSASTAR